MTTWDPAYDRHFLHAARETVAFTMDKVGENHAPAIITRNRDQAVVMMSLGDYEALEETAYLLKSPKNAKRIMSAIAQLYCRERCRTTSRSGKMKRKLIFSDEAWEDYLYWQDTDRSLVSRINLLIKG